MMFLPIRRTLVRALIVSLVIHLVLLLGVAVLPPVQPEATSTTINVVVNREARRASPEQATSIAPEKPVVVAAQPSSSEPRKTPKQTIIAADQSIEALMASVQPASPEAGVSAHAMPAAEAKSGAMSASTSMPEREGVSADEITDLRYSLSRAAKRFKVYPPLARERGWEGTVEVALIFTARSSVPDINLVHSSGRAILDEQAMDIAARAARATVLSAGLKGRDFQVPLPFEFSLEDDQ